MSADLIMQADGVKAVSAVALDARKRAKEEAIIGRTVNKFGRVVIVSRKKYSHMRKCGDLLLDLDGNQARFTKLSDAEITAYKTGDMRQNQKICKKTPEDITDLEIDVKAILKKDHEESQVIRKDFIQHQADVKNKKEGNITVVTANDPLIDAKKADLDAREADIKARENALKNAETKVVEKVNPNKATGDGDVKNKAPADNLPK